MTLPYANFILTLDLSLSGEAEAKGREVQELPRTENINSSTASDASEYRQGTASDDPCDGTVQNRSHCTATDKPEKPTEEAADGGDSRAWEEDVHIGT